MQNEEIPQTSSLMNRWICFGNPYGTVRPREGWEEGITLILNPSPVKEKEEKQPVAWPRG